ncbi:MAG: alpha/beta hydrolase [Chloroflexota bacterium]
MILSTIATPSVEAEQIQIDVPVIDEGSGPPVVFLHGVPDHRSEWREVIDLLRTDFRCLAPDLPGFGHSPQPPPAYDFSIRAQVAFFDDWINRTVGNAPVLLVMHDIGAIMGMAWASHNPQRVHGMIVMNTVLHADFQWHTMARIWRSPILGRLFMLSLNRFAWRLAFRRDFPQVRQSQVDSMYDGLTSVARQSILRHFRQMTSPDFFKGWEASFTEVTQAVPTTVLWGGQDPLIPQSYAQRIGGTLKPMDDCSHWVPLEKPAKINDELRAMHRLSA